VGSRYMKSMHLKHIPCCDWFRRCRETRLVVLMRKSSTVTTQRMQKTLTDHRIAVALHTRFLHRPAFKQHMTIHGSNATAEFRPMTGEYVRD
jgi:hypothetical protein